MLTLPPPVPARWLDSHQERPGRHLEPPRDLEDLLKALRCSGTDSCEGGREWVRARAATGGPGAVERPRAEWGPWGQFHIVHLVARPVVQAHMILRMQKSVISSSGALSITLHACS